MEESNSKNAGQTNHSNSLAYKYTIMASLFLIIAFALNAMFLQQQQQKFNAKLTMQLVDSTSTTTCPAFHCNIDTHTAKSGKNSNLLTLKQQYQNAINDTKDAEADEIYNRLIANRKETCG